MLIDFLQTDYEELIGEIDADLFSSYVCTAQSVSFSKPLATYTYKLGGDP